jgi:hypothetical protein
MSCKVIALSVRLDVAKINLMLSSECSQIGTGSSNSPRSASQSVRFTYIFGGVRNSARNVAFFLPAAHRRASTHAEFTRFGEHSLRANRNGSLQRLNALWAAFAPPSPSPGGRKLNFNRSDLSVPERPRLPLIVASLSRGPAAAAAPAPGYGSKACSSSRASTSHAKCWRSPGRKACIDTWIATMSPGQSSLLRATGFVRPCWRTSILRI